MPRYTASSFMISLDRCSVHLFVSGRSPQERTYVMRHHEWPRTPLTNDAVAWHG
jgi:hypothetical protein